MILTVGHSNHPIARFVELLTQHAVATVVDVRSTPFSRFNPQFNRQSLEAALVSAGICYLYLGEELGARSTDPACYEGDRVSYARLAQSAPFKLGLQRVRAEAHAHRLALMCAEREPLDCHRTILVSRELTRSGVVVAHILADGSLEPHERTVERLLESEQLAAADLFLDSARLVDAAYDARGAKIAYLRPPQGIKR